MRHFGRRVRRSSGPRAVIQSFKKVLNFAPTSHAAAADITFTAVVGTDSVAAGQTAITDTQVPTGSVVKYIEWQLSASNLVSINNFLHWSVQSLYGGQSAFIAANVVGGSNQRNQVFKQGLRVLGQNQNTNITIKFKIPRKFQRVREGGQWALQITADAVWTDACQVIYKFYR